MGNGRLSVAIAALALLVACGKTLELDAPAADAGADAPPDAPEASSDAGAEASSDAAVPSCGASRARALRCGGTSCNFDGGEICCVENTHFCASRIDGCPGTQWNCQGQADCPSSYKCCQTGGYVGSQCLPDCSDRPRYCYGSAECDPGQGCVPGAGLPAEIWQCAPCP